MPYLDSNKPVILLEEKFPISNRDALNSYLNSLPWSQDEFLFRGKACKSPRETVYFGEKDYVYSGITQKGAKMPKELRYIADVLAKMLDFENGYFDACLLNKYRDGKDSISYHKDDEKDMAEDSIIAVLSVGTPRKFCLKHDLTKNVDKYLLDDLSIVVMNPICQKDYRHAILKELKSSGERISLTFRRMS